MHEFYILSAVFWVYAMVEFYFAWRHKTRPVDRKFDATLYAVTVPFLLLVMNPIYFFVRYHSKPDGLHLVLFVAIYMVGIGIRALGLKEIGRLFSQKIELRESHRVISTGIYHYIRHPLYLGSLVMAIGTVCYLLNSFAIILLVLLAGGIMTRIGKEETYLNKNLDGYREYSKRTKRLLPGIY